MTTTGDSKLLHFDNPIGDNILIRHFAGSSLLSALQQNASSNTVVPVSVQHSRPSRPKIPPPPPPPQVPTIQNKSLLQQTISESAPLSTPFQSLIEDSNEQATIDDFSSSNCESNQINQPDALDSIRSVSLKSQSRPASPIVALSLPSPASIESSATSDCDSSLYYSCSTDADRSILNHINHERCSAVRAESFGSNSGRSIISNVSSTNTPPFTSRSIGSIVTNNTATTTDHSSLASPAPSSRASNDSSAVQAERCSCQCHCAAINRRSSVSLKTGKLLLSSLAKLTLNSIRSGLDVRLPATAKRASPAASLSSLGSFGASLSGGSSVQENNYGHHSHMYTSTTGGGCPSELPIRPPNRPPPPPPIAKPNYRTAALLPEPEYEDSYGLKRSVENLLRERFAEYADVADFLYERLDSNDSDRKAEADYDSVKDEEEEDDDSVIRQCRRTCFSRPEEEADDEEEEGREEDEDLYQDVLLFESDHDQPVDSTGRPEERIYETLSLQQAHAYGQAMHENLYINRDTINSEIDRKLFRKQKMLDKKRRMQADKLRRKFNLSGNEIPLNVGVVKADVRGNQMDLRIHRNEIVLILRIDGNPPGKWLAKNERGKIGYVDLDLIDVDIESIKSLMNVPNVLTENPY